MWKEGKEKKKEKEGTQTHTGTLCSHRKGVTVRLMTVPQGMHEPFQEPDQGPSK